MEFGGVTSPRTDCVEPDQPGRSHRPVPVAEQLTYVAHLAAELADLLDGTRVKFKITP